MPPTDCLRHSAGNHPAARHDERKSIGRASLLLGRGSGLFWTVPLHQPVSVLRRTSTTSPGTSSISVCDRVSAGQTPADLRVNRVAKGSPHRCDAFHPKPPPPCASATQDRYKKSPPPGPRKSTHAQPACTTFGALGFETSHAKVRVGSSRGRVSHLRAAGRHA